MLLVSIYLIYIFNLIVVSFSSFCVFISLCVASIILALALALSSCLVCNPSIIELPLLRSLLTSVLCGCLLLVSSVCDFAGVFCFLLTAMSFPGYFLVRSIPSAFPAYLQTYPRFILFDSVYLVTTAGSVADQPM